LLDPGSEVSQHYGVRGFPTTLFIDAEGKLQHARVGELSTGSLAEGLEAIRP
jgi:thioredoxin-related protein